MHSNIKSFRRQFARINKIKNKKLISLSTDIGKEAEAGDGEAQDTTESQGFARIQGILGYHTQRAQSYGKPLTVVQSTGSTNYSI